MRFPARPTGRAAALLYACLSLATAFLTPAAAVAAPPEPPPPIFVLNSLDASVSVINPVDWTEKQRIPTGKEPHHIYMTPDEKSVIVANSAGDSLTFVNPRTAEVQRVVYGIVDPYQLQFSRDMKWFVTAGNRLNHVDVYHWDGKDLKLAKRIPTGKTPSHIWIDRTSTIAYVTMQDSDELIAVDLPTQTIRWRTATGPMPADIYGAHGDKTLLVGLTGSDGVQVFDVAGPEPKLVGKIPTGKGAHAFRAAGDGKSVFVSNPGGQFHQPHRPDDAQGHGDLRRAGRSGLHGRVGRRQDALRDLALGQEAQRDRPREPEAGAPGQRRPFAARRLDPGPCEEDLSPHAACACARWRRFWPWPPAARCLFRPGRSRAPHAKSPST
ncbi:hypothetical protein M2165_005141 [Variovorax sp. TBS-050B]|nr:hypothetical protein [Variovorax sp. TBS-050B]